VEQGVPCRISAGVYLRIPTPMAAAAHHQLATTTTTAAAPRLGAARRLNHQFGKSNRDCFGAGATGKVFAACRVVAINKGDASAAADGACRSRSSNRGRLVASSSVVGMSQLAGFTAGRGVSSSAIRISSRHHHRPNTSSIVPTASADAPAGERATDNFDMFGEFEMFAAEDEVSSVRGCTR
jgi:hypothetical protein